MVLPLFGDDGKGTLSGGATAEQEGRRMYWDNGLSLKTISFKYILSAARTFSISFRHFNGKAWTSWQILELNDSGGTTQFSDTAAAGILVEFNMELQRYNLGGMVGGQMKIVGISSTGDVNLYNAYGTIAKN